MPLYLNVGHITLSLDRSQQTPSYPLVDGPLSSRFLDPEASSQLSDFFSNSNSDHEHHRGHHYARSHASLRDRMHRALDAALDHLTPRPYPYTPSQQRHLYAGLEARYGVEEARRIFRRMRARWDRSSRRRHHSRRRLVHGSEGFEERNLRIDEAPTLDGNDGNHEIHERGRQGQGEEEIERGSAENSGEDEYVWTDGEEGPEQGTHEGRPH